MSEAEIEMQINQCEQIAEEAIQTIEAICEAETDQAKKNWKIATMMHSTGSILLGPALAMARLNLTEDEYTDFRARVYQSVDAGCDEIYEAAILEASGQELDEKLDPQAEK